MNESGENGIKYIEDIGDEFNHTMGNRFAEISTYLQGMELGRTTEDEYKNIRDTNREAILSHLDSLLASEFDARNGLDREKIEEFRDLVLKTDWENTDEVKGLIEKAKQLTDLTNSDDDIQAELAKLGGRKM